MVRRTGEIRRSIYLAIFHLFFVSFFSPVVLYIYIYTPPPFTSKTSRKGGRLCKRKVPGGSHPDGTRLGEEEEPRAIRHSYGALTSEGRNPLNESVHAVLPRRTCTSVQPRVRVRERVRRTPSPLFFFLFSLPATHESLL